MKIETRSRWTEVNGLKLKHHDLVLIPEGPFESEFIDLLGDPGSYVQGQVRLADGYGEHYLLIQPRLTLKGHPGANGYSREFPEYEELLALNQHRVTVVVPNPQRAATPEPRKRTKAAKENPS